MEKFATNANDIKNWIKQLRTVRPVHDAGIIIKAVDQGQATQITLLDTACCVPAIVIKKPLEQLTEADLQPYKQQLNHKH